MFDDNFHENVSFTKAGEVHLSNKLEYSHFYELVI